MAKMTRLSAMAGLALVLLHLPTAHAQWTNQTITLVPGWNPVFLSLAPSPSDCDSVFGSNTRILSVRRWAPPVIEAVQYDTATGAIIPQNGSWLTWFPTNHPNRALLNLAEVGAGAYLIEVSDGASVNFSFRGRPVVTTHEWQPGSHHFVGLPAFGQNISFTSYFESAGDKILVDYRSGGEIYSVDTNGAHQRIFTPNTTFVRPGVAYWVKAQQYSTFSGPIDVKIDSMSGWADFGRRLVPQYLEIKNNTAATRGIKIAHLASGAPPAGEVPVAGLVPLKYAVVTGLGEAQGRTYLSLPNTWTTQLLAGASIRIALLPDALGLVAGTTNTAFQSILEVTDDGSTAGLVRQRFGVRAMARLGSAAEAQGLWVGEVNITDVGRLQMPGVFGIPQTPRPVNRPFTFRILAHVDTNGTARLLQRVFIGTRPDANNGGVITDLLATETRANSYKAQHPGAKVFRLSSANFPFMSPLVLSNGLFGVPNQAVLTDLTMSRNDSVNPFLHAFAPMHDNKERRAEDDIPYSDDVEVFSIRRSIEMVFQGPDQVNPDPRWGETTCGGVYREKIYGLGGLLTATNRMITVEGRFVLQRASVVPTLQQ